jgi:TadE-like protein
MKTTPRLLAPRRPRARGISMVEFAIVFPFATLFVLTLIQLGMVFMAKMTLNNATFMAARIGSLHNAKEDSIREAMIRGLSPFYQDSTETNDTKRLAKAYLASKLANDKLNPFKADIEVLSPSADTFTDFGINDPKAKVTYIPNDNLEWRTLKVGTQSRQNIRDANLLKLRVRYGYELKVPLIAGVLSRVMCGGTIGPEAYGNVKPWNAVFFPASEECIKYYARDRIPLESFAIVEMQSRAEKTN